MSSMLKMVKMVKIKNLKLGEGKPKICVPVVEKTEKDILKYVRDINKLPLDIMEWRADFYVDNILAENTKRANIDYINESIINVSRKIKKITDKPMLFTLRTYKEGGNIKKSFYEYLFRVYKTVIENKCFDSIDLELFTFKENDIKKLVKLAKEKSVKIIISNHDFNKTPSKKDIVSRINKMIKLKCDVAKVAYMPKNKRDVIVLLNASNEISETKGFPLISISMGEIGIITRIFGSVLTFASAKRSSAPGQLDVMKLKYVLDVLYI